MKSHEKHCDFFLSLRFFKLFHGGHLQLRAAGKESCRCSGPTWCATAPPWPSACTCPWRRRLPRPSCCRRTPPTSPRCPCRVRTRREEALIFHFSSHLKCDTYNKRSQQHGPLRGEDPVDDRVPPVLPLQDEDVVHHVEDEVELRHGAHQLGFQERRPLLLQCALTTQVALCGQEVGHCFQEKGM